MTRMVSLVVVMVCAFLCMAKTVERKRIQHSSRIINGVTATSTVVWQVGFQATSGSRVTLCGGTLVTSSTGVPQYVVTAAHCVKDLAAGTLKNPSTITVTPGRSLTSGPTYAIQRYWVNPLYDRQYSDTAQIDLAILQLTRAVSATDGTPAGLCTSVSQCEISGAQYLVSGYGDTTCTGSTCSQTSTTLLQIGLQYVDFGQCSTLWRRNFGWDIPTTSVCAAPPNNGRGGTCFGDSGGPLVYNTGGQWLLVGAVSTSTQPQGAAGDACGEPGQYGVFVSIAKNINWVRGVLSGNTTTPSVDAACVASNTCQTAAPVPGVTTSCSGISCIPWYYYVPAIIAGVLLLLMLILCCVRACASNNKTRHAVARHQVHVVQPAPPKPVSTASTTTYTIQMQPMAPAPPPPVYQTPVYQPNPYQPQMYTPQYGAGAPPAAYGGPAPSAPPPGGAYNPAYGHM